MMMRGVRGAVTVEENTAEVILEATQHLLGQMIAVNDIDEAQVASVLFTTTPDLTACYPAKAARLMGWQQVALMGFQEAAVPQGLPRCIRILIHWNTEKNIDELQHIFMGDAKLLRPDLTNTSKVLKD